MFTVLLDLLRLLPFLSGGHRQHALENLALRQQLAVFKRTVTRPKLRSTDRLFRAWLFRAWTGWRTALVVVAPRMFSPSLLVERADEPTPKLPPARP